MIWKQRLSHCTGRSITTREIAADLIEKLYGHHYSPATVSNITEAVQTQVQAFHNRTLSRRYVFIFYGCYIPECTSGQRLGKKPLHVLLGITPEGNRGKSLTMLLYLAG